MVPVFCCQTYSWSLALAPLSIPKVIRERQTEVSGRDTVFGVISYPRTLCSSVNVPPADGRSLEEWC